MFEHSDRDNPVESFLHVSIVLHAKLEAALSSRTETGNPQEVQLVQLQVGGFGVTYLFFRDTDRNHMHT